MKFIAAAKQSLKVTLKSTAIVVVMGAVTLHATPQLLTVAAQASAVFSRIDVAGNERIASDTIRSISGITPGKRVTPGEINAAIQNLYDAGLFEKVSLNPERGLSLIHI